MKRKEYIIEFDVDKCVQLCTTMYNYVQLTIFLLNILYNVCFNLTTIKGKPSGRLSQV